MSVMRSKAVKDYFQRRGVSPSAPGELRKQECAKPSKYRNVPTVVDGIRFASKAEAKRDAELLLLQRAGKIRGLKRQPRFKLTVGSAKICTYVGDWQYWEFIDNETDLGITVVEDRKGVLTPAFKIKWALAKALYPHIEFRLS